MSAARTTSYSLPTSKTRVPFLTSQATAMPGLAAAAAAGQSRSPLRLNLRT